MRRKISLANAFVVVVLNWNDDDDDDDDDDDSDNRNSGCCSTYGEDAGDDRGSSNDNDGFSNDDDNDWRLCKTFIDLSVEIDEVKIIDGRQNHSKFIKGHVC